MTERCEELVVALSEGTLQQRVQAAKEICLIAELDADARARLGGAGAISALVALLHVALDTGVGSAQKVVTLSLLFITLDDDKNKVAVVAAGAVPLFIKLLQQAQSKRNDISQLEELPQASVEASGEGEASGSGESRVPNSNVEQQLEEKDIEPRLEQEIKQLEEKAHRLAEEELELLQAVEAAIRVAENEDAMQAAVYALLSLSYLEENKACIGSLGAIPLLLSQLLTIYSKPVYEGVLLTLINLAVTSPSNGLRMVRAGGILILMHALRTTNDMLEKILSLLSFLARIEDGRDIIVETPNALVDLVDFIIDTSSEKEKELVVATLYLLCTNSLPHMRLVLDVPSSDVLMDIYMSDMSTPLARLQAAEILNLFVFERRKSKGKMICHAG